MKHIAYPLALLQAFQTTKLQKKPDMLYELFCSKEIFFGRNYFVVRSCKLQGTGIKLTALKHITEGKKCFPYFKGLMGLLDAKN